MGKSVKIEKRKKEKEKKNQRQVTRFIYYFFFLQEILDFGLYFILKMASCYLFRGSDRDVVSGQQ